MSYITEIELSNYRSRNRTFSADNIVGLNESALRDKTRPMIFLSHKHDEHSVLQDVVAFFKKEGADIYVDWMDPTMPAYTNAKTAHKLKQRIKVADKFILVATSSAINSKWCNWELGLGDAEKYIEHIALLPINRPYENFNGAEYLKIYPRIEYQNRTTKYVRGGYVPRGYYVLYPANINGESELIRLRKWLKAK